MICSKHREYKVKRVPTADCIDCLKAWLIKCSYWYYSKADPLISDYDFDMQFKKLQKLEHDEGRYDEDSPTQMIYGESESQYPEWCKEK